MLNINESLRNFFLQLKQAVLAALLIFASSSGQADDTDIYMGTGTTDAAETHPNVLFILDTSGSMNRRDAGADKRTPRMTVLKDAMDDLLSTLDNVNVGLSRFSNSGGSVVFPITPINGNANIIVGESTTTKALEFKAALLSDNDDGEERVTGNSTGEVFLNDEILEMFEFGGTAGQSGTTSVEVALNSDDISEFTNGNMLNNVFAYFHPIVELGLRFQNVGIAQGATIQAAFLDFTTRNRSTSRTDVKIGGINLGNVATFTSTRRDLSTRPTTSATVEWDGIPGTSRNRSFSSPDVAAVVQEIVNRSDWQSGNAMGFRIKTKRGFRMPYSRNGSATFQPKLRIQMAATGGTIGDDQLIALRFEDIRIPRGATLQEAKLLVTNSAGVVQGQADMTGSVVWKIQAEQVDDSAPLSSTANNLSSRKGGGTVVNWTVSNTTLNVAPTTTACSVLSATGTVNTCADQFTKATNDIKSVVHQITNRSGWCGGNAITFLIDADSPTATQVRKLYSRDSDEAALAPKFVYSYMPQKGCMSSTDVSQIASSGDDAEEFSDAYAGTRLNTVSDDLVLGVDPQDGSQTVGLRFTSVEVPKGVTVKEAHIEFRAKGTSSGAAEYTIKASDVGNVGPIARTDPSTAAPLTSASATWSLSGANAEDNWDTPGAEHLSPDLTAVVQEIVNRDDWSSKNNMGFVITGTGTRTAESFDSDPSKAPRLVIKYDDSQSIPFKSVREVLKEKVKELPARGGTPIAGAMLETAKYFRGEGMVHGKNRGSFGQISHPGTYCLAPGNCPGATATSSGGGYYGGGGGKTDEFFVLNPNGCSKNNLGSSRCRSRKINGNPVYLSPVKTDLECASNHQVLLTDGAAGGNDSTRIKNLIGTRNCHQDNSKFKLPGHIDHKYSSRSYYGSRQTSETCIPDLVEFMATKDQNKSIPGKQNVTTHTVAFGPSLRKSDRQFLKDVANLGGGNAYSANTAGDLQEVFQVILSDVRSAPSSFAAPALAIDAFNKLTSRSDVYYGMFTPELTQRWNGNIKKYKLCLDNTCGPLGDVLDADNISVVDKSDPKRPVFKSDSRSVWSDIKDGQAVTKGGAGAEIIDSTKVVLLTDKKDNTTSFEEISGETLTQVSGLNITEANWKDDANNTIRSAICKTPSTDDGSECEKRMLWMLGKKHVTDAENDVNQNQRWSVGDVLHSSPVVITYGGTAGATSTFIDKVVYGTNAGFLHMVNGKTGIEEWRYMPSDFWSSQRQLFDNRQDKHMYGMDSTPTVWMCDKNGNGIIEPTSAAKRGLDARLGDGECGSSELGDFVRVITSTRRGGGANGFIYALDVTANGANAATAKAEPMFMWRIAGGNTTGDFSRLGQTWSQPRITTVMVDGGSSKGGIYPKDVLIFGGGYDSKLDDITKFSTADNDGNDYLGNAIYIVDPMNGKKILSISGQGSGADIIVDDMHFSIPSRIEFLDSNVDGLTDRLYVGDLGGQVWRVDLSQAIPIAGGSPAGGPDKGTVVGLLAQIAGNAASERRRFYEPPSIVQVSDELFADEPEYDYVLMGTGNRPSPLEETVKDRFYAFRDRAISNNALGDASGNHVAGQKDNYPDTTSSPYSHSDSGSLIDVTQKGMAELAAVDEALIKDSNGWFIDYATANSGRAGEKTLSSPLTAGGAVSFTTFDPAVETTGQGTGGTTSKQAKKNDPCSAAPNIGTARAYHLTILGADVPEVTEISGGRGANRYRKQIGSGIPSDVIPVFTDQGVVGIVQADGVPTSLGQLSSTTPERAYWNESIDF